MGGRVYLGNAFSLGMLSTKIGEKVMVSVTEVPMGEWVSRVSWNKDLLKCVIGHKSTASLAERILGFSIKCERTAIKMKRGDILYVIQPKVRLPEGKILGEEELKQLVQEGKIGFYVVVVL